MSMNQRPIPPGVQMTVASPKKKEPEATPPSAGPGLQSLMIGQESFQPNADNYDPSTVEYYEVSVDTVFISNKVHFVPGRIYKVSPAIYLGTLEDGSTFASHCVKTAAHMKE